MKRLPFPKQSQHSFRPAIHEHAGIELRKARRYVRAWIVAIPVGIDILLMCQRTVEVLHQRKEFGKWLYDVNVAVQKNSVFVRRFSKQFRLVVEPSICVAAHTDYVVKGT